MQVETKITNEFECILCKCKNFTILLDFQNGKATTSDSKLINQSFTLLECNKCFHIQKQLTSELRATIKRIYDTYEAYYLTNGKEEYHLEQNIEISRSQKIIKAITPILNNEGTILDIGTGSGVFLEEFNRMYPLWKLYAQDVKISEFNTLQDLKNFKKFFLLKDNDLNKNYFDFISAIYVFEHILEIDNFLISVKNGLKDDGILLLQVPNINENLFDLFIIDHVSHFTKKVLYVKLKEYFEYVYFPIEQIYKEITIVASDKKLNLKEEKIYQHQKIEPCQISNLIKKLEIKNKQVAIFGTSPAAIFCANYLDLDIAYFIDENKNKCGKSLCQKEIIHPNNVDSSLEILFPYPINLLTKLQNRYPNLKFIHII